MGLAVSETSIHDQDILTEALLPATPRRISLVVDHPAAGGQGLLLLPFAAPAPETVIGRQIGLLLQRRLQILPELTVGHGLLVAVSSDARRYLPLPRPLSADQARTCGAGWHAAAVLYGTIAVEPSLRWHVILREVATGAVLFEDTLSGDPADLLAAPARVARAIAHVLGHDLAAAGDGTWDAPDTARLDALLAYLEALDARPQHGVATAGYAAMCAAVVRACVLDPAFRAPAQLLIADLAGADDVERKVATLTDAALPWQEEGAATLTRAAALAEERGHLHLAESLAEAALNVYPAGVHALELAARLALRTRRFADARALVNALLDRRPDLVEARILLGDLLAAEGRYAGAAQQWELVLEERPRHTRTLMRLGVYLAVIGDHRRAHTLLRQAAAMDSMTPDALFQLGAVSYRAGAFTEAVAALQRLLADEPTSARAHALLARCYRRLGRDDEAYLHEAHAVALAPALWPSALALGYGALRAGRPEAALVSFAQVVNMRPDLPDAWYALGLALLANEMPADAASALLQAATLQPTDVSILCALALAHHRADDSLTAAHALRAAETLAPQSAVVARYRAALQRETTVLAF